MPNHMNLVVRSLNGCMKFTVEKRNLVQEIELLSEVEVLEEDLLRNLLHDAAAEDLLRNRLHDAASA